MIFGKEYFITWIVDWFYPLFNVNCNTFTPPLTNYIRGNMAIIAMFIIALL